MAVLTADREVIRASGSSNPLVIQYPVTAAQKIYKGSIVALNAASTYALYAASAAASRKTCGIAAEQADNSLGVIGLAPWSTAQRQFQPMKQNLCMVYVTGLFVLPKTTPTISDIGKGAWPEDSGSVLTATPSDTDRWLGACVGVWDATNLVIQLKPGLSDLLS